MRKNYFVNSENNTEHIGIAWRSALQEITSANAKELLVVVEAKAQFGERSDISVALGKQVTSTFLRGGRLLKDGKAISSSTSRTLPRSVHQAVILLIHPPSGLMTKVDSITGVSTLFVVPWMISDVREWVDAHGPIDLLSSTAAPSSTLSNAVVAAALKSLLNAINTSTGLAHPLDKNRAIDTFRILSEGEIAIEPNEIRAHLIQSGLKPKYADEIAAIAANPSNFRKSTSKSSWRSDILKVWQGKADS